MATPGYRSFVSPPDKGSFPIDHDGECKDVMKTFMTCMRKHGMKTIKCRDESKAYLKCRMENNLMAEDSWENLGFEEAKDKQTSNIKSKNKT